MCTLRPSTEAIFAKESSVLVIVPAYNEQEALAGVVRSIQDVEPGWEILVINDGSTDNTGAVARATGVNVIDLPRNLGIGGAIQTGFKFAFRHHYQSAIQIDGDGQHLPSEAPKLLEPLRSGIADVVIGSRFIDAQGCAPTTRFRKAGIWLLNRLNTLLTGHRITDSTSGFRAYNREAIALLSRFYPQDYPEPEAVVFFHRNRLRVMEVAVEMRVRQGGTSSIGAAASLYYMVKVMIAMLVTFFRRPIQRIP